MPYPRFGESFGRRFGLRFGTILSTGSAVAPDTPTLNEVAPTFPFAISDTTPTYSIVETLAALGATGLQFITYTDAGLTTEADDSGVVASTSYTPSALPNYKQYWVVVTPFNGATPGAASNTVTFYLNSILANLSAFWELNESSDGSGSVVRQEYFDRMDFPDALTIASGTLDSETCAAIVSANSEFFTAAYNAALDLDAGVATGFFTFQYTALTAGGILFIAGDNNSTINNNTLHVYCANTSGSTRLRVSDGTAYVSAIAGNVSAAASHTLIWWVDTVNDVIGICLDNGTPVTAAFTGTVKAGNFPIKVGGDGQAGHYADVLIKKMGVCNGYIFTAQDRFVYHNSGAGSKPPFLA